MLGIGFLHPKKHHVHSYVEYNFVLWLVDEMTSHQAPLYFFPFKKAPPSRKNKIKTTYDKPPNSHPIPFRYRNISALPFEREREREDLPSNMLSTLFILVLSFDQTIVLGYKQSKNCLITYLTSLFDPYWESFYR